MRTLDGRATAFRVKGKYGVFTEYLIQSDIYRNPEACRFPRHQEQRAYKLGQYAEYR